MYGRLTFPSANRKPLPLSPGHVLRNGAAFFLCQARHDGEQQFALAVKGVDVLFFEVDFYAFFFQLADGNQAVNRVSGEATDRLCDDEVDFTGHGIGDHFIKADAMLGVRAGNALVGCCTERTNNFTPYRTPGARFPAEIQSHRQGSAGYPCARPGRW